MYELSVSVLVLEALVDVSSWSSIWSAAAKTASCALLWLSILCSRREWSVSCRYRGSEADVRCVGAARAGGSPIRSLGSPSHALILMLHTHQNRHLVQFNPCTQPMDCIFDGDVGLIDGVENGTSMAW
jgi:hypothetical protein